MMAMQVDAPVPPPPRPPVPPGQPQSKSEAKPELELHPQPSGVATAVRSRRVPTPPPRPPSSLTSPPLDFSKIEESIEVPGFGRKGEGKDANYGAQVPEPQVVSISELPPEVRGKMELGPDLDAELTSGIPQPIAATTSEVEGWIQSGYTKLVNLSSKVPPEVGESILWKGLRRGKSGGPSTKEEFFHGRIRYVTVEKDEIFLFLD